MTAREFIGELLGTFLLVLFGCGSVAVSVLFGSHSGLMQVALAWGIGGHDFDLRHAPSFVRAP